eukprot:m.180957 g.180957  ORF g.180957 m.180957 type:complete len:548 (+) comp14662_c1_seq2:110-1753(+)
MDVMYAVSECLQYACSKVPGLKAIIAEDFIFHALSMANGQSMRRFYSLEVFLLDRLTSPRELLPEVSCIVFCQPNQTSIAQLCAELGDPKYKQYSIFFTNSISESDLQAVAEADAHNLVKDVEECFMTFLPHDQKLFSSGVPRCLSSDGSKFIASAFLSCQRTVASVLQNMSMSPSIRFQNNSPECQKLALSLQQQFSTPNDPNVTLLIVDRRDDPVTPLLIQYTYRAMVHDFFGIEYNKANLASIASLEDKRPAFSAPHDPYLRNLSALSIDKAFGESAKLKRIIQKRAEMKESLKSLSLSEMKKMLASFEEYEREEKLVSTHLGILLEINSYFKRFHLHDDTASLLSDQAEIIFPKMGSKSACFKQLSEVLPNPDLRRQDKLKLIMLFIVSYSTSKGFPLDDVFGLMEVAGLRASDRELVQRMVGYSTPGRAGCSGDACKLSHTGLYLPPDHNPEQELFAHTPLLASHLNALSKGSLSMAAFPAVSGHDNVNQIPKRLVVYYVGGTTYKELDTVQEFCNCHPEIDVILGGSTVHNFESFCEEFGA